MFRDWYIFYSAGKAVLQGKFPYSVIDYYNPIQVAWILAPTTILPFEIWVYVMIALSFIGIVALCKRKSHLTLLSFPFVFGMTMGSLDVLLWVPSRLLGGVGLSLLTLKPQLAVVVAPLQLMSWYREDQKSEVVRFFISTILLWGIPTLIHPGWFMKWVNNLPPIETRLHGAASLAGFHALTGGSAVYLALFFVILIWLLFKKRNDYYLAASFSPSFWPSDWMIAAEHITWRFTVLSWLLVPTGIGVNGAQFYFLLGFLIWIEKDYGKIKSWLENHLQVFKKRNHL